MKSTNFWFSTDDLDNQNEKKIIEDGKTMHELDDSSVVVKKIENKRNSESALGYMAVLLPEVGTMQTIFLPIHAEGIYRFNNDADEGGYDSIYIEARYGEWHISCNRPVYFRNNDGSICYSLNISDQEVVQVNNLKNKCTVCIFKISKRSLVFHNYVQEMKKTVQIGKKQDNDIIFNFKGISEYHANLVFENNQWYIKDISLQKNVYVNGRQVDHSQLNVGDRIFINGLQINLGIGFISINDENGYVTINPNSLQKVYSTDNVLYFDSPFIAHEEKNLFNRKPRRRKSLNLNDIVIDSPPLSMKDNRIPLFLRMGSSMVMGANSLLRGSYTMILTSVLFPMLSSKYSDKQKKEYEERRIEKYSEYLKIKENEIYEECEIEKWTLNYNYPELSKVLRYAEDEEQLWERRNIDDDFLELRIGTGKLPMLAKIEYSEHDFQMEEDELEKKMYELAKRPFLLTEVPIRNSFVENYISSVVGEKEDVLRFVKNLIMELVILHSYDEVKTIFLIDQDDLKQLEFIKFLPHAWNDQRTFRYIATDDAEAYQISEVLKREIEEDIKKTRKLKDILKERPYYMIFALNKKVFDSMEVLKDVVQQETNCGISVLTAFEDLPKECFTIFELHKSGDNVLIHLKDLEEDDIYFELDSYERELAEKSMKKVSNTYLKVVSQVYSLPKMLTFLEMYGVGKIEHLNIQKRWTENNPIKSLAAPVGVSVDGSLFYLDLHEKFQGPHGLVAGMTGSGKSEFLLTYILSMAVNYHPDEVAFILIDYKGGGLAGAFDDPNKGIHLPHLFGTITNLDGPAIQRSLVSIQSELKRRQKIFNIAKSIADEATMDIYLYQKLYRRGVVQEPLPHLFIISDEFAELKQQEPEFMDQLISIARIGRSLGIHLILATQKPAGVVNEQIRSNTKFRVCLKVQDRSDSMDMLKRPEAAELKDIGRFYLQVGYNEFFSLGQSAWSGAPYEECEEVVKKQDGSIQFIDSIGQTILAVKDERVKVVSNSSQIVSVVKYLSNLAKEMDIGVRSLWRPPLSDNYDMEVLEKYSAEEDEGCVKICLGLVDDPVNQQQFPMTYDFLKCKNLLITGENNSGKTTFLESMILSAAKKYSAEEINFYILDYSSRMFKMFHKLPHCGAILNEEDSDRLDAFFELVESIIDERKKLFLELEVNGFEAACGMRKIPLIIVVIDNIAGMIITKRGEFHFHKLQEYMKQSANYGIKYIISCTHLNEASIRIKQELGDRICFHMKDRYEYGEALGCRCNYMPPEVRGRGLYIHDDRPLEMQIGRYYFDENGEKRTQSIKNMISDICKNNSKQASAKKLPLVSETETYAEFITQFEKERLPIGYHMKDAKPVALPFKQFSMLSIYFGNSYGVVPVLENVLSVMNEDSAKLFIIKKSAQSCFDLTSEKRIESQYYENAKLINPDSESIVQTWQELVEELVRRKELLIAYCKEKGLDAKRKDIYKDTFTYMRENTFPIVVVFESFAEICEMIDESSESVFCEIFKLSRQYNTFIFGCFYPGEGAKLIGSKLYEGFNQDKMTMLFGGQLDKQTLAVLPREYASNGTVESYNKCIMKYRDDFYPILMPCGEVYVEKIDEDDLSIF